MGVLFMLTKYILKSIFCVAISWYKFYRGQFNNHRKILKYTYVCLSGSKIKIYLNNLSKNIWTK